jgi:hypothetical protein
VLWLWRDGIHVSNERRIRIFAGSIPLSRGRVTVAVTRRNTFTGATECLPHLTQVRQNIYRPGSEFLYPHLIAGHGIYH